MLSCPKHNNHKAASLVGGRAWFCVGSWKRSEAPLPSGLCHPTPGFVQVRHLCPACPGLWSLLRPVVCSAQPHSWGGQPPSSSAVCPAGSSGEGSGPTLLSARPAVGSVAHWTQSPGLSCHQGAWSQVSPWGSPVPRRGHPDSRMGDIPTQSWAVRATLADSVSIGQLLGLQWQPPEDQFHSIPGSWRRGPGLSPG